MKVALPPPFGWDVQVVFLCLVAMAKEVVWSKRLKELKTVAFPFNQGLIDFFKFHLKRKGRLGWEVLSPSGFGERRGWIGTRIAHVNGCTLSECLQPRWLVCPKGVSFLWLILGGTHLTIGEEHFGLSSWLIVVCIFFSFFSLHI